MALCSYCSRFATDRIVIEDALYDTDRFGQVKLIHPAIYVHACDLHQGQIRRAAADTESAPSPQTRGWVTRRLKAAQLRLLQ